MATINLTELPREQLPRLIDSIIDKKVSIYFCMTAHSCYEFLGEDGRWPSQTGRYQLKYPAHIVDELQRLYRGEGLGGISLSVIVDNNQRSQYVVRTDDDGWSPDEEGNWHQGITLVRFPYDHFQVEWLKSVEKPFRPRSPSGLVVWKYLCVDPNGNLPGLRAWAKEECVAKFIEKDKVKYMRWIDDQGIHQEIREKRLSDLLSEYRDYLD